MTSKLLRSSSFHILLNQLASNGCKNQLLIGDYNTSLNTELDYVDYAQDPHKASREFLHGLQEDGLFIDVFRFLNPYDLSNTWKVHNSQKRSRIDLAFANQNLISGIREMKHIWCQQEVSDHAMVTVRLDYETIDRGHGILSALLNYILIQATKASSKPPSRNG